MGAQNVRNVRVRVRFPLGPLNHLERTMTTLSLPEMARLVEQSSGIPPSHLQSYYSDAMYYIITHEGFRDNFRFMIPLTMGIIMLTGLPVVEPEVFAEELASFVEVWAITHSQYLDDRFVIDVKCRPPDIVAALLEEVADSFIESYKSFFRENLNV
jgi:hypothetical protein